jgi:hypothetical protein
MRKHDRQRHHRDHLHDSRWLMCLAAALVVACKTTPPPPPGRAPAPSAAQTVASDHLPDRPDLKICKKEWTAEQCCAFLCSCLHDICGDSARAAPGLPSCAAWCPTLTDKARRCHVYHCYVSISPTGGIKDHDSHCGHAADQLPGGACPGPVFE